MGHRPQAVTHRAPRAAVTKCRAGTHHRPASSPGIPRKLAIGARILQETRAAVAALRPAGPFPPLAPTPSLATRRVHDDCIRALTAWGHPKNFLRAAARLVQILLFSKPPRVVGLGHSRRYRGCSWQRRLR